MALFSPISLPWTHVPNSVGPVIEPICNGFSITRRGLPSGIDGWNQWTYLSLPSVKITNGWTFEFDVKYDQITPRTEVKLTLSTNVILRYNPDILKFQYTYYINDFIVIADSNIAINDNISHHVALNLQPTGVQVVEDGIVKGFWTTDTTGSFEVEMDWQILDGGAALQAEVTGILASPTLDLD
ncbi:hypothetical protein DFH09DRAFT_1148420 [Mycena vulgaris]|nr:hypothetical protein DFH09DRAFT_1148420 [Mycena vulgaris]